MTRLASDPAQNAPAVPATDSAQARWVILALSGVVFLLVATVIYLLPSQNVPGAPSVLATLNACLNATAALCRH